MCEKPRYLHSQKTGFNSDAELTKFWNHVLSTKHSDITMKFLRAALSIEFLATFQKHPSDFYSNSKRIRFNPYILRPFYMITFWTLLLCWLLIGFLMRSMPCLLFNVNFQVNLAFNVLFFCFCKNSLRFQWFLVSLSQILIDFLGNKHNEFSGTRVFTFFTSKIDTDMEEDSNVLTILSKILQKIAAGKIRELF